MNLGNREKLIEKLRDEIIFRINQDIQEIFSISELILDLTE